MRVAWAGRYLRILNLASISDPVLSVRLCTSDFVTGLDPACLEVIRDLFPSATQRSFAALSDEVPWRDAFGIALLPLGAFLRAHGLDRAVGTAAACGASALRQCTLVARLLTLRATAATDGGRAAFELLLRAPARWFEPSFQEDSDGAM